jgi:hypothetical protein
MKSKLSFSMKNAGMVVLISFTICIVGCKEQDTEKKDTQAIPSVTAEPNETTLMREKLLTTTKIAFCLRGDIYTIHPDGTNLQQLTDTEQRESEPAWSGFLTSKLKEEAK